MVPNAIVSAAIMLRAQPLPARGPVRRPASASSSARSGGLSRAIPAPPATIAAPTPHATTPGDTVAAHRITTAGPTMYDSSPCTDSSANAARRCPAVVIAAIACLVTDWAGTISRPAAKVAPSRIPYGRTGTPSQNTTCDGDGDQQHGAQAPPVDHAAEQRPAQRHTGGQRRRDATRRRVTQVQAEDDVQRQRHHVGRDRGAGEQRDAQQRRHPWHGEHLPVSGHPIDAKSSAAP